MMQRNASAVWNGNIKEGNSHITTQSTVLNKTPYSFISDLRRTNNEKIIRSELLLTAKIPGISEKQFQEIAHGAEKTYPVSGTFNFEITLSASLQHQS
ncbi:hypothetical protein [Olivibacter sp. XZL3]|uniref:hypothetical protein n=1 Tax=Olivibacter sp. XZL3 TaxID=1735116 RepID=UPI001F0F1D9C|nr:hypothetical protein [Olivibacter sp. XZL3]